MRFLNGSAKWKNGAISSWVSQPWFKMVAYQSYKNGQLLQSATLERGNIDTFSSPYY